MQNRHFLPSSRTIRHVTDADPVGDLREQVAYIWSDILDVDEMGSDADFFDLGGQSLGAIRITAEVREILTDDVPLGLIFERPGLDEYVEALAPYAAG